MTFLTYSFIGWLWESVFVRSRQGILYRGFLLGPYCPVYGFGVVAVLIVPSNAGTLLNLYFNAVVIVTIVEFVTSWLLEKLFGMKLWDYTKFPLILREEWRFLCHYFWGDRVSLVDQMDQPDVFKTSLSYSLGIQKILGPLVIAFLFLLDVLSTFVLHLRPRKKWLL